MDPMNGRGYIFSLTKILFKAKDRVNRPHPWAAFFARWREKKKLIDPDREQQPREA